MSRRAAFLTAIVAILCLALLIAAIVKRGPTAARNSALSSKQGDSPSADAPARPPTQAAGELFTNVTSSLGINFSYYNNADSGRFFNGETNGGGVAWLDYDNDGWPDLYFTNGCKLPYQKDDRSHTDRLFQNQSGRSFIDCTDAAGVAENGFGHAAAVGDINSDGYSDLYVTNFGSAVLYRNNGDGTFSGRTHEANVLVDAWCSSAAFGDLDRDGNLDLYVTVYAVGDLDNVPLCEGEGYRVYCGPDKYPAAEHQVFRNTGAGGFENVTRSAGFSKILGKAMGVVIANLDEDEWPDVFVANDKTPSYLFHNRSGENSPAVLRFDEIGVEAGVATNGQGALVAGMGIACADFDDDARLDLYVTHYQAEMDTFYRNRGKLFFTDDTAQVGLGAVSLPYLGFGVDAIDYDNDGWLDLYVANGHVLGAAHFSYAMPPQLHRNLGNGRFAEITSIAGEHFRRRFVSRGLAIADYDRDGGIDLAVTNNDQPAYVAKNTARERGHWLRFELVGARSNRTGINARITVRSGARTMTRELVGGGSYQSASEQVVHFGLGKLMEADDVTIRWPSGAVQNLGRITGGQTWLLVEGRSP